MTRALQEVSAKYWKAKGLDCGAAISATAGVCDDPVALQRSGPEADPNPNGVPDGTAQAHRESKEAVPSDFNSDPAIVSAAGESALSTEMRSSTPRRCGIHDAARHRDSDPDPAAADTPSPSTLLGADGTVTPQPQCSRNTGPVPNPQHGPSPSTWPGGTLLHCTQMLGFDVLLDADWKAWLLEVNHTPDIESWLPTIKPYGATSDAHHRVKTGLVADFLTLMRVPVEPGCGCDAAHLGPGDWEAGEWVGGFEPVVYEEGPRRGSAVKRHRSPQ